MTKSGKILTPSFCPTAHNALRALENKPSYSIVCIQDEWKP